MYRSPLKSVVVQIKSACALTAKRVDKQISPNTFFIAASYGIYSEMKTDVKKKHPSYEGCLALLYVFKN
jgi:hypothetical protein